MRVLLDEQLPRRLARALPEHEVRTVQQQGWAGLSNGELLRQAESAGFGAFVTADQNLQFQQNLRDSSLFFVVLVVRRNTLEDLLPLIPAVLSAIDGAQPGRLVRIGV